MSENLYELMKKRLVQFDLNIEKVRGHVFDIFLLFQRSPFSGNECKKHYISITSRFIVYA